MKQFRREKERLLGGGPRTTCADDQVGEFQRSWIPRSRKIIYTDLVAGVVLISSVRMVNVALRVLNDALPRQIEGKFHTSEDVYYNSMHMGKRKWDYGLGTGRNHDTTMMTRQSHVHCRLPST